MTLETVIKTAQAALQAALDGAWEAGRASGLESAATKARDIAAKAKSDQGRAACEAVARGIEELK
jgi:hypothetical protein